MIRPFLDEWYEPGCVDRSVPCQGHLRSCRLLRGIDCLLGRRCVRFRPTTGHGGEKKAKEWIVKDADNKNQDRTERETAPLIPGENRPQILSAASVIPGVRSESEQTTRQTKALHSPTIHLNHTLAGPT